jgi:hypothetical protein
VCAGATWSPHRNTDGSYDERAFRFVVAVAPRLDPVAVADVIGHTLVALSAGLGPRVLGEAHHDGDGLAHARLSRYPIVIVTAKPARISRLVAEAREYQWVRVVDYPEEGWATTNDLDYRDAIKGQPSSQLVYRGASLFGPAAALDKLCGHFNLWRPETGAD